MHYKKVQIFLRLSHNKNTIVSLFNYLKRCSIILLTSTKKIAQSSSLKISIIRRLKLKKAVKSQTKLFFPT